ncbi:MAG: N-acetylmuramoyl-L-alanine amidase [Lachnospiraceae bacterium]|nr:N-acetylmuramoyl-L-alanine amidase [Lachnospiraceae bacterium]
MKRNYIKKVISLTLVMMMSVFVMPDIVSAGTPYPAGAQVTLNPNWLYANYSAINSGAAVYYAAGANRNGKIVAVNAGHGTVGGTKYKTYCHPDMTPKLTGGSTSAGAIKATAVSGGMTFNDGTSESAVTLRAAQLFRDKLLAAGYDVLMIRDGANVNLDNVARTVISNNVADCHIALHFDGDGLSYDKGCFYISTPEGLKTKTPVSSVWQMHELLGTSLVNGLACVGTKVSGKGKMVVDLTQTSYSTIPSVDLELGNQCSNHSDAVLSNMADGMVIGVNSFFGF